METGEIVPRAPRPPRVGERVVAVFQGLSRTVGGTVVEL